MIQTDTLPTTPAEAPRTSHISRSLIAKSVLSNWSYLSLNVLVAFWITPFLVHHLGDSLYGVWGVVLQLTGYMGVVDVGLRSALVRFVSRFRAQGDHHALNQLLNNTIILYWLMAPFCFLVALVLAVFALPRMQIPPNILHVAQVTVFIAAACVASDFIFATSHAVLAGLSRWDLINSVWIPVLILRTILFVLFLQSGFGLITVALIHFGATLLGYFSEVLLLRRLLPEFRAKWQFPRLEHMRPIMEHGWYSFLLSVATKINYQVDSIVIALFLPIGQVTFYIISLRLIEYLRDLLNSTTMIVAPIVSTFEAVGQNHRVIVTIVRGTKYSLFIAFLGVSALFELGSDFIGLWMGPRFVEASGPVLVVLAIGVLASSTQFASSQVLYGLSKHRLNVNWTVVEAVVNLGLSVLLVRRYGIIGVAAGTMIANVVVRGWFYPRSFLRGLNVPWKNYVRHGVLPALPPSLLFLAGTALCKHYCPIRNYATLAIAVISGLLPFALWVWFLGLDKEDREAVRLRSRGLALRA
jgi:O-antigen/teichoic acid export membrane protein